jgi:tRNA A-37 threonylcarbamoyl transferase component Bud32
MPITPYVVGQWVRGDKFYGRRELLDEILRGNRNCLWLLGTRRIGKTSILKELESQTSAAPELGFFSLFWDFQGAEKPEDLNDGFAESLLDASDRLEQIGIPLERVEGSDLFESMGHLRRELRSKNLGLLLLGDEVEELVHINKEAPRFLRRLRRALQSAENIRTVLASKIKLWELSEEKTSTSPFLHGFTPPLFVRGLSAEDSRALIRQSKLPDGSKPDYDDAAVEIIRSRCNHHPYLLQILCERYLELNDLEKAVEEIATDQMVRHFFAVDFEMLTSNERNVIRAIGSGSGATSQAIRDELALDSSALNADLARLEHLGFIRRSVEGGYSLANFFFERWFHELPSVERAHQANGEATLQEGADSSGGREILRRLDERYELLRVLGKGAAGEVYQARDTLLRTVIAVKLLKREYSADPDAMVRLSREVTLSRDLSHPNILKVYHLGDDRGQKYVTMQYVAGANLATILSRESPLAIARALTIGAKLAAALEAAHEASVIHRDIKPSNILLDGADEPRIADFGLARLMQGPELTRDGVFLGTPLYASPEQIRGEPLDARSDVYSLGIVFFEMLTGRRPFHAEYSNEVAQKQVEEAPPVPHEIRSEISRELSDLVLRCLAKDPGERVQSAGELRVRLGALER